MVTVDDVRKALDRPARTGAIEHGIREAATAAILAPRDGALELLFMRRAEYPGDPWSGQVSLPGGRIEPGDVDRVAAARRETGEEVGVDPGELLGALDHVGPVTAPRRIVVYPFVFLLPAPPEVRPNPEVASVHRVGLDWLLSDVGRTRMKWPYQGLDSQERRGPRGEPNPAVITLPCVDFDGVRLWGLTLRVVDDLLDRLDGRGIGMARLRT